MAVICLGGSGWRVFWGILFVIFLFIFLRGAGGGGGRSFCVCVCVCVCECVCERRVDRFIFCRLFLY